MGNSWGVSYVWKCFSSNFFLYNNVYSFFFRFIFLALVFDSCLHSASHCRAGPWIFTFAFDSFIFLWQSTFDGTRVLCLIDGCVSKEVNIYSRSSWRYSGDSRSIPGLEFDHIAVYIDFAIPETIFLFTLHAFLIQCWVTRQYRKNRWKWDCNVRVILSGCWMLVLDIFIAGHVKFQLTLLLAAGIGFSVIFSSFSYFSIDL